MACSGNSAEICGGPNALSLYSSGKTPSAAPTVLQSFGLWTSLGCFTDSAAARTLLTPIGVTGGSVTPQRCMDACSSATSPFRFAGVEFAAVCFMFSSPDLYPPTNLPNRNAVNMLRSRAHHVHTYFRISIDCGNTISNGGVPATDGCNMACAGDPTLLCGGPNRVGSVGEGLCLSY